MAKLIYVPDGKKIFGNPEREIYRANWHDYRSRCIYMVTVSKARGMQDFGILCGNSKVPHGEFGSPFVSTSPIGSVIKSVIRDFNLIEPNARILQYSLMPDHLHLLIFVEAPTEATLGIIIARFKAEINQRLGMSHIFDKGFNDQILKAGRSLDTLYNYLRDNPRRLAVRREHPEYFRRVYDLKIGEKIYPAYGNFQLLANPFKEQVVVHRADTPTQREHKRRLWLYTASNGGVLVSPFISSAEKAIRSESEEADGRIILITNEPFSERYKPSGRDYILCETGRLLIISAGLPGELTRENCLTMNKLAGGIAT